MRIGNEIVTASALGKRRRMFRIFGDKGKCIVVPLDDNLISKVLCFVEECTSYVLC